MKIGRSFLMRNKTSVTFYLITTCKLNMISAQKNKLTVILFISEMQKLSWNNEFLEARFEVSNQKYLWRHPFEAFHPPHFPAKCGSGVPFFIYFADNLSSNPTEVYSFEKKIVATKFIKIVQSGHTESCVNIT